MKFKAKITSTILLGFMVMGALTGCSEKVEEVIIYSNADDEATEVMKDTLDANGYEGQYIIQSFGSSELGGKILAEGKDIEADVISMSSYYLDTAQETHNMFIEDITNSGKTTINEFPSFYRPVVASQASLIINTEVLAEKGIDAPTSLKDLASPMYAENISVVDVTGSTTAWLMLQALFNEYGEEEGAKVLEGIYANAGAHTEPSGSGPIKKVRAGEIAIGFGLRHQAVADKADGLPVDYIDPAEGNFTQTESLAVVNKGESTNPLAEEMVQCIIENGREEMIKHYPVPLYEGEVADESAVGTNPKTYPETLTVELLQEHIEISENAKP